MESLQRKVMGSLQLKHPQNHTGLRKNIEEENLAGHEGFRVTKSLRGWTVSHSFFAR